MVRLLDLVLVTNHEDRSVEAREPSRWAAGMKSIYRKLDVNTGADAVHEGQAHGLI